MLEKLIEKDACDKVLDELGVFGIKLVSPGRRGYPDRMFLVPGGKPVMVEFKQLGEKPDPLQHYVHDTLRKLGYHIEVFDNVEDCFNCIRAALHTAQVSNHSHQVSS